jgi:beta-xylosidase
MEIIDVPGSVEQGRAIREGLEQARRKVAEEYGVSGAAIAKVCRKLEVPVPGRGYWAKKELFGVPLSDRMREISRLMRQALV